MTPWGEPDLQGMWPLNHLISTPFQRPERFGERRLLTDEEFAAAQKSAEARNTPLRVRSHTSGRFRPGNAAYVFDERSAEWALSRAYGKGQGTVRQDARQLQAGPNRIR